jgi:hypothetical protein
MCLSEEGAIMRVFELLSHWMGLAERRQSRNSGVNRRRPRLEELEQRDLLAAVSIVVPADGATVAHTVEVEGDVSGMNNPATIDFYVDSSLQATTNVQNTYALAWASDSYAPGAHTLSVQAHDSSGHTASASSTIFVRGLFNVMDYGAKGDGRTIDTAAIQAALNAAHNVGGGTVYLPSGTYLIDPRIKALTVYSNIEVLGAGQNSVVKVADLAGNYSALFGASGDINYLTLRDFRVDQNPSGNHFVDVDENSGNSQVILRVDVGRNVTVQGMAFDEDGVNGIVLTGHNSDGAIINDCQFHFVRARSAGWFGQPLVYDHSSIYVDGADQVIRNNVLTAASDQQANTAIEVHGGPNVLVEYNQTSGFHTGTLVLDTIPQFPHADGHFAVRNNQFLLALTAIALFGNTGQPLRYVTIADNHITFRDPNFDPSYHSPYTGEVLNDFGQDPFGILFASNSQDASSGSFDQIQILNNVIDYGNVPYGTQGPTPFTSGIELGPTGTGTNILIQGNTVINSPNLGISVGSSYFGGSLQHIRVEGNTIVNAAWIAVMLDAVPLDDVRATGNTIQDTGGATPNGVYAIWAHPSTANQVVVADNDLSQAGALINSIDSRVFQGSLTATTTAVVSSMATTAFGQAVTFTATVSPSSGTTQPTGTVSFVDGSTVLGTATLDGQGRAALTTALLRVGDHTIAAVYGGDTFFGTSSSSALTQTVNQTTTTTAVTSSNLTAAYGQSLTFTATVSRGADAGVPTGPVTFLDGTTVLGTAMLDAQGRATFTTVALAVGSHSISAAYAGNSSFSASTSTVLTQTVTTAATITAIISSAPTTAVYRQAVTFMAAVIPVSPAGGVPTGAVTFREGATVLGAANLNGSGQATFTTTALSLGSHAITAAYGADPNFIASTSSTLLQTVSQAATATTLLSTGSPAALAQAVTFTALVNSTSPGSGTATGTVTFLDGTMTLGAGTLDGTGQASFTVSNLGVGSHSITAVYVGDTNYTGNTSAALVQVVLDTLTATSTTITSSGTTSVYSQAVTFTAIVSSAAGTPAGTVTFRDGITVLGTATLDGSGQATLTTNGLALGNHAITAVYGGNSIFSASTATALTQNVGQASTIAALNSSAPTPVFGQAITFTATVSPVSPAAGVPTGTVTFFDASTVLGTAALDGSGNGRFTIVLALGSHSITATYGADTNFTATISPAMGQTVSQDGTMVAVTSSANPSVPGQAVAFTVTVQPLAPGAGRPMGAVSLLDGAAILGTAMLDASGRASFTITSLSSGSHDITAVYAGDSNFAGNTSPDILQIVSPTLVGTTSTIMSDTLPSSVFGRPVTFTATVSPAGGAGVPTGTVTFRDGATVLGTIALNPQGQANLAITTLAVGSHSITAVYAGDTNFAASTSLAFAQTVNRGATSTRVTSSDPMSVVGQAVTFTATVTAEPPAAGVPTGVVIFLDGATVLGSALLDAQGHATLTTSQLTAGLHNIMAVYGGDVDFSGLMSEGVSQRVN